MQYDLTTRNRAVPDNGAPVWSREFLRRARRVQGDLNNPDRATAQTVELMADQIHKAAGTSIVESSARKAVNDWRGGPLYGMTGRDPYESTLALAESCWWFAKHHVKFVHHNELIAVWFGEKDQLQLLISPEVLLEMRRMEGDCAIYTMLICAMLEALGLSWEIVTAAVNPYQPDVFSHVWPRVILEDGRRVSLDASHGDYVGWQVPQSRVFRLQVWNEAGQPIGNAQSFEGLHGYEMRGMGDDSVNLQDLYPVADPAYTSSVNLNNLYPVPTNDQSVAPATLPGTQPAGFNSAQFFGNLAQQWTSILGQKLAPTTQYVRNADGSVSLVTPGSSPVLSGQVLSGGALGGGSSLLWIGGGILALVVIGSMMKGK